VDESLFYWGQTIALVFGGFWNGWELVFQELLCFPAGMVGKTTIFILPVILGIVSGYLFIIFWF